MAQHMPTDPARDLGAPGHSQRPTLAEVVLRVDQDQRPMCCGSTPEVLRHVSTLAEADQRWPFSKIVGMTGSPRESCRARAGSSALSLIHISEPTRQAEIS